jgi:hypothetical protein
VCLTDRLKRHFGLYTCIEYMSGAVLSLVMSSKNGFFFIKSILEVINVNLECCQSMVSLKMWKSHDPLQLTGTHPKDRT